MRQPTVPGTFPGLQYSSISATKLPFSAGHKRDSGGQDSQLLSPCVTTCVCLRNGGSQGIRKTHFRDAVGDTSPLQTTLIPSASLDKKGVLPGGATHRHRALQVTWNPGVMQQQCHLWKLVRHRDNIHLNSQVGLNFKSMRICGHMLP